MFYILDLAVVADISQVVIAVANLVLAGYIFIYQQKKDQQAEKINAQLNEQNIKLQWFKELIVEPNKTFIDRFYANLAGIRSRINSDNMSMDERRSLNEFVKAEMAQFRKSFIDVLLQVDRVLGEKILTDTDKLIDDLTDTLFDEDLKLSRANVVEKNITAPVFYAKNNLIGTLYNYKGVTYS